VVVLGGALLAVLDRAPPGPRSLCAFEPDRVADLELEMWKAYYGKEKARLFALLVTTLREQYRLPWHKAIQCGWHLARAASTFASLHGDYRSVLPDLRQGYAVLADWTGRSFDPERVADDELAWWVARRTPGQDGATNVGRLIGEEYAALYAGVCNRDDATRAGLWRAEAAHLRDAEATMPDWDRIDSRLRASYRSLRAGMEDAPGCRQLHSTRVPLRN